MPKVKLPKAECTKFDMPPVCVVTGSKNDVVWKEEKFQYMPQWAYFIGGVVLGSIFMKKMTAELPFSAKAYEDWRRAKVMTWVAVLAFLAGFIGGPMVAAVLDVRGDAGGALMGMGMLSGIVVPIVLYFLFIRNRGPRCLWMDEQFVEVMLPSDAAVAAIREHFGAERTKPRGFFG